MNMKKRVLCAAVASLILIAPLTYGQNDTSYIEENIEKTSHKLVIKPGYNKLKMEVGDTLDHEYLQQYVMFEDGSDFEEGQLLEAVILKGYQLFEEHVAVKSGTATIRVQVKDSDIVTDACIKVMITQDCGPVEPEEPEEVIISHMPYIYGYEDGTFRPERSVTREELASMVSRLILNGDMPIDTNDFKDINDGRYSAKHAAHLNELGIMLGLGNQTFNPQQPITRGEMAAVIERTVRHMQVAPYATRSMDYTDVSAEHWAYDSIRFVTEQGFMEGSEVNGTMQFLPNTYLTRAEAVTTLNKVFGRVCEDVSISNPYSDLANDYWAYDAILYSSVRHEHKQ